MANRKVLINRHSTKNQAPSASEMFLGEIAVSHPIDLSATTIYTRNGDVMVPFASCAMTMQMIDNAITAANVTYDVKKDEHEPHIEVATAGTGTGEVTFTLTSNDIASKAEYEAYSARTNNALTALTKSFADLLDVTLTAGTGDDIITVATASTDVSANTFTVKHKAATAVTGFNKLDTDGFGHVTAATPVTTEDIQALGFKTSAQTGADLEIVSGIVDTFSAATVAEFNSAFTAINTLSSDTESAIDAAIKALDSTIAVSEEGKYITGIAIADGMLSAITEADIPVLSVESAGTGNVVSQITVQDHKITYQTASVATSEDIDKLSAATIALSAGTVHDFEELSGATEAISGYAHDEIAALSAGTIQLSADTKATIEQLSAGTIMVSGYAHGEIVELSGAVQANETDIDNLSGATVAGFNSAFTAIQAMDKDADAVDGKVVTTVSEVDGVVSETKANVKDLQLGGYVKDTAATGDIAGTDTINAALSKLENKAAAITIANADGSINVTTGATGTDINVNIKSGEHVLAKDGDAGLYTNIKLSALTPSSDLVKEEYALYGTDDTILGDHIKIYKDQSLVSITLENNDGSGHTGQYLKYTYIDASGNTQSTYVNVSSFLVEAEFASGVTADASGVVHGVVDPTTEGFLTVGADGFKVSGVQDAIDSAINALDVTGDTAAAGQYVAAIEQTDGVVAVKTRANVSEAVLNNYAKGTDATAVAATDTVNGAISKLENQIDKAKAAATTKVVEGTDAGNNISITPSTGADGSVTYTVDLTDVASKTALDAEIAARKAVDGQNGDTYAANTSANYISGATSLNDADLKLDTALKAVANQVEGLDYTGLTNENMKVVTDVKQENGLVSASATAVGDLVITAITTADTKVAANDNLATIAGKLQGQIDAMDSSTATTDSGHFFTSVQIADGKITAATQNDKVNSATTAESADTAASADKVANALSISGYSDSSASTLDTAFAYDGSAAKSLTFGTNGSAGLKSMSMTDAGVVDVEVIDCGEY